MIDADRLSNLASLPEAPPTEMLRALADPTRVRILELMHEVRLRRLRDGACFGGSISQHLGLTQPTVSHHMKILVEAGLVLASKQGTTVYYELALGGFECLERYVGAYLTVLRTNTDCDTEEA